MTKSAMIGGRIIVSPLSPPPAFAEPMVRRSSGMANQTAGRPAEQAAGGPIRRLDAMQGFSSRRYRRIRGFMLAAVAVDI
jgi:hypothetical protein